MNVYISSHLGKGFFICFLYSFVSECLLFQGLYLQLFIEPFCMNCLSLLRKKNLHIYPYGLTKINFHRDIKLKTQNSYKSPTRERPNQQPLSYNDV